MMTLTPEEKAAAKAVKYVGPDRGMRREGDQVTSTGSTSWPEADLIDRLEETNLRLMGIELALWCCSVSIPLAILFA